MIGYHQSPLTAVGTMRAPATGCAETKQEQKQHEQHRLSVKRENSVLSSNISNHLALVNKAADANGAGAHSLRPTNSPGYHSAASSPSSSSVASPVSSSSAACSSSSGNSTASSISPTSSSSSSSSSLSSSVSNSAQRCNQPNSPNLLDYYPETNQDGLGLSWFHDANNRAQLSAALSSQKMVVAGDISLAEMSRYPVPIMAKPPLGVSDITLENWLQEVAHSPACKGVKLTFTSTRTIEPAFRVLARHADQLKGPLILNADILARPQVGARSQSGRLSQSAAANQQQQQQQPVDAWTFLMLCRTRFPKCIISIGWCSTGGQSGWQNGASEPLIRLNDGSSSADSMFELDILDAHPALLASHLQHNLSQANQQLLQQNRLHQHHPYALIHQHQQQSRNHHLHLSHQQLSHQLSQHHANLSHHILSSTGSLNSSSGNSSGSPSPTSPVGHLMSPAGHQTVATNLSLGSKSTPSPLADSTEQLFLAAATAAAVSGEHKKNNNGRQSSSSSSSSAAAAAAAMAAAVVAASNFQQQLPLNLNINEASDQQQQQLGALSNLAHKIQSYQSISQVADSQMAAAASSALASKLFNQSNGAHIQKKTALGGATNPNSPSPQSSSPRQHPISGQVSGNLLLKTTQGRQADQLQQQQQQQQQPPPQLTSGYTREMIDKMASLVKEYNLTQAVTFPVEAKLLRVQNSLGELQRLLYQVGANSTLTVVAQPDDLISIDDLLNIRKAFSMNQLLFDLPDELASSFRQELDLLGH